MATLYRHTPDPTSRQRSPSWRGPWRSLLIPARGCRWGLLPRRARADPAPALPGGRGPRYTAGTWAEDRATRGRDPSADPGAKTGAGGTMPPIGIPGLAPMR